MRRRRRHPNEVPRTNEPRVNNRIRVPRVLLIDESGRKLGEFLTRDALELARERGLDLVEVAPQARPPVCRIQDYGRFKYEKKKRETESRRKQSTTNVKEVKIRPKTDQHDFEVKRRHAERFLLAGDKVKVTVRFRGREHAHRDIGTERCREFAEALVEVGVVEAAPRMDGRQMVMILAPKRGVVRPETSSSSSSSRYDDEPDYDSEYEDEFEDEDEDEDESEDEDEDEDASEDDDDAEA